MDIKSIMKRQGWTMDRIAEKMGKTQSNVSQIINNPSPTLTKLREIAGIIGCEWWEFFLDEIDPAKFEQARERGGMPTAKAGIGAALLCPHCGGAFTIDVRPVAAPVSQQPPKQTEMFGDNQQSESSKEKK